MRAVPDSLDATVVAAIDERLVRVAGEHGVTIPWAVESGSRAWGFPSPDSDYDCRFVFVRPRDAYLSPWPPRDVIETPLDRVLDVNGWDLVKALRLLEKGNAVLLEWLRSPIVYHGDTAFRDGLLMVAEQIAEREAVGRHYLHVGLKQWTGGPVPSLKKFFYALRPAASIAWLRVHPSCVVPPMDLPTLLVEAEVPDAVRAAAEDLIARKAVTRELGGGEVPPALQRFVLDQYAWAEPEFEHAPRSDRTEARRIAERFFLATLERR